MIPFDTDQVRFGADGLVPVVAQEATTGEVLMLAWANREALERTASTRRMHYWSRTRGRLWRKGEESGHDQEVVRLALDCDGDAVLALVHQSGPACHRNTATCYGPTDDEAPRPVLAELAQVIDARRRASPPGSYTAELLGDPKRATKKIGEESAELVHAIASESEARVAEEAADVLYHVLVACAGRGVTLRHVLGVLERRRA